MQIGFYFDQSRCIGCYVCVAACRSWNQLEQELPDLIDLESQEKGEFPDVSLRHLFLTCFHCGQPSCVPACPEGILVQRAEDGIVVIADPDQCTKCMLCVEACPYDAPKVVAGAGKNIVKCDMCLDRLAQGRPPACVASCPTQALDVGPMEEMTARYGGLRELDGFADYRQTNPSVVFRAASVDKVV